MLKLIKTFVLIVLLGSVSCGTTSKRLVKIPHPNSPCPEYIDLLEPLHVRGLMGDVEDIMLDLADREVCLIGLVEKYKAYDVWEDQ